MKDIYNKLEIPEASANLEDRIIAAATQSQRNYLLPKLAVIAVCFVIIFSVMMPNKQSVVTKENMLSDIEFFDDEQYGFYEEIS